MSAMEGQTVTKATVNTAWWSTAHQCLLSLAPSCFSPCVEPAHCVSRFRGFRWPWWHLAFTCLHWCLCHPTLPFPILNLAPQPLCPFTRSSPLSLYLLSPQCLWLDSYGKLALNSAFIPTGVSRVLLAPRDPGLCLFSHNLNQLNIVVWTQTQWE